MKASRVLVSMLVLTFMYQVAAAQKKTVPPAASKNNHVPVKKPATPPAVVLSPAAEILRKLVAASEDLHDDGGALLDTLLPSLTNDSRFHTFIQFPGAISSNIDSRYLKYSDKDASVNYNWIALLARSEPYAANYDQLLEEKKQIIKELLPSVKDSVAVVDDEYGRYQTTTWNAGPHTKILLQYISKRRYNLKDEVSLIVETSKHVKKDPAEIVDAVYNQYTEKALSAPSRNAAVSWFMSMLSRLQREGVDDKSVMTMCIPVYQKLARDTKLAFDIIMRVNSAENRNAFVAALSESQKAEVSQHAKKVVDDFNAKYDPPKQPDPAPAVISAYTPKINKGPVPITCPACKGAGMVDHHYYHKYDGIYSTIEYSADTRTKCGRCNGNGYVYITVKD